VDGKVCGSIEEWERDGVVVDGALHMGSHVFN
jgi:hypothetical protein